MQSLNLSVSSAGGSRSMVPFSAEPSLRHAFLEKFSVSGKIPFVKSDHCTSLERSVVDNLNQTMDAQALQDFVSLGRAPQDLPSLQRLIPFLRNEDLDRAAASFLGGSFLKNELTAQWVSIFLLGSLSFQVGHYDSHTFVSEFAEVVRAGQELRVNALHQKMNIQAIASSEALVPKSVFFTPRVLGMAAVLSGLGLSGSFFSSGDVSLFLPFLATVPVLPLLEVAPNQILTILPAVAHTVTLADCWQEVLNLCLEAIQRFRESQS
jgi:hypothetical protein